MPVEFKFFTRRVGLVFLNSVADVSENFSFGRVVDFGMIFDLINGSETKVGGGDGLLCSERQLDNGDVEGSGCFLKNLQGALVLCLHGELNFLIILLNSLKFRALIILLRLCML